MARNLNSIKFSVSQVYKSNTYLNSVLINQNSLGKCGDMGLYGNYHTFQLASFGNFTESTLASNTLCLSHRRKPVENLVPM